MSIAMGFRNAPRCLPCLSATLERDPAALRDSIFAYIRRRECYLEAWNRANDAAGLSHGAMPPALQFASAASPPTGVAGAEGFETSPAPGPPDAEWDAGGMGCGELVLALKLRLDAMPPGQLFKLWASDPGVREDLPSWCRLTGHRLMRAEHPNYWIRRKE